MTDTPRPLGGLTPEQVAFCAHPPHTSAVRMHPQLKQPYIPVSIVTGMLNAAFGLDGWSYTAQLAEKSFPPKDGKHDVCHRADVVLRIGLRDEHGRLTGEVFERFGVAYDRKVHPAYGDAASNSAKGALSRALSVAARTLGPMFGLYVVRLRTDAEGRSIDWRRFCSDARPTPPDFGGVFAPPAAGDLDDDADAIDEAGHNPGAHTTSAAIPAPAQPERPPEPRAPAQPERASEPKPAAPATQPAQHPPAYTARLGAEQGSAGPPMPRPDAPPATTPATPATPARAPGMSRPEVVAEIRAVVRAANVKGMFPSIFAELATQYDYRGQSMEAPRPVSSGGASDAMLADLLDRLNRVTQEG